MLCLFMSQGHRKPKTMHAISTTSSQQTRSQMNEEHFLSVHIEHVLSDDKFAGAEMMSDTGSSTPPAKAVCKANCSKSCSAHHIGADMHTLHVPQDLHCSIQMSC